jgi:arsenate reductase
MKNILVLCTGNSCRSQIAEGWLKYFSGNTINVYSAGIHAHGVNSNVIKTMEEVGVDVSNHSSNVISDYAHIDFDFIITVCDHAAENCPIIPSKKAIKIHFNFFDPSKIVENNTIVIGSFRKTRDEIKEFCKKFIIENIA